MLSRVIGMAVLAYPVFQLLGSGSLPLVVLGFVLSLSVCQSLTFGPMAAFVSEQFSTRARYTEHRSATSSPACWARASPPVIVASLIAVWGSVTPVIGYLAALCVVSAFPGNA